MSRGLSESLSQKLRVKSRFCFARSTQLLVRSADQSKKCSVC